MSNTHTKTDVQSLEKAVKKSLGSKYDKVSPTLRKVIAEMDKCQDKGGAVASKPAKNVESAF